MITLQNSTGQPQIDALIAGLVAIYEAAFPGRVRGYYVVGSFGYGAAIRGSDIDIEVIFKDAFLPDEVERFRAIRDGCRALAPVHLDLTPVAEVNFAQHDTIALKLASRWVYGADTRDSIPLPDMDGYLRRIAFPTQRALTFHFRMEQVELPLQYPLPDDEFFGYVPVRYSADDMKLWVLDIGWMATFLTVLKARVYVISKQHMLDAYRQHINDDWLPFIEAVYENGRHRWQYRVPTGAAERAELRALCQQTLTFENHVARIYVDYLKTELDTGDSELARQRLRAFGL